MREVTQLVRDRLMHTRRLTLCLDLWTKKGMSASFLGISACAYNPDGQRVEHLMLNLHQVNHPHMSDMIAHTVSRTLSSWDIKTRKVMLVITDDGTKHGESVQNGVC